MASKRRTLLTGMFINRLSMLHKDVNVLMAVSYAYNDEVILLSSPINHPNGNLPIYWENIDAANPGMHSIFCGRNVYHSDHRDETEEINVRTICYQDNGARIFCYVDREDLALDWARRHRIEVIPGSEHLRIIELSDDGEAVHEFEDKFIESGGTDHYPSLLAERVRGSIKDGGLGS